MRTAEQWAGEIAARVAASTGLTKAYGGGVRHRDLAKMLRPAGRQLARLEQELERQREQLDALIGKDWAAARMPGIWTKET